MKHGRTTKSFLISLSLNLFLLLALSFFHEHREPQTKDAMNVEFTSLPKVVLQKRSLVMLPRASLSNIQRNSTSRVEVNVKKEVEFSSPEAPVITGIVTDANLVPSHLSVSPVKQPRDLNQPEHTGEWQRNRRTVSSPAGRRSGIGRGLGRRIVAIEPKAMLSGSGKGVKGYYRISLVRYEDSSDTVSTAALRNLAGAMNRWTKIKTTVMKEPIRLDDPAIANLPMIYITSSRPFAFSEQERQNLRRYFEAGGFLMFSNTAAPGAGMRSVANSIEFELWKVLEDGSSELTDIDKKSEIYKAFFDISNGPKLRANAWKGRIRAVYENSGCGLGWKKGTDTKKKPYLKLGVNIIVYALTTSPIVDHQSNR